jgi:hypothetical protein
MNIGVARFSSVPGIAVSITLPQAAQLKCESNCTMSARGNEIRFVKGKYTGYYGWVNKDEIETLHSVPVIVQDYKKPEGTTHDKETKVRKTSVRSRQLASPRCFEEAVFQQHPDIEDQMEKLC